MPTQKSPPVNAHVRQVMKQAVVTLPVDAPIEDAFRTFEEHNISGAPVVDGAGVLVGVLSAHDLNRRASETGTRPRPSRYYFVEPSDEDPWSAEEDLFDMEDYSPESNGRETVREWMTPRVLSVTPDATLQEACRVMVREGVHRILVVEEGSLRGILSTFDVVRWVANA